MESRLAEKEGVWGKSGESLGQAFRANAVGSEVSVSHLSDGERALYSSESVNSRRVARTFGKGAIISFSMYLKPNTGHVEAKIESGLKGYERPTLLWYVRV